MTIRVLVNGAHGKMGQASVKAISHSNKLTLVGTLGREDDLITEIKKQKADVVVDFTNAEVVLKNTQAIVEAGARPVVGTSGLTQESIQLLQKQCAALKQGGIIAPNFSLGAVLMMKYAKEIVNYFPHVEIIEMHHNGKLDSPSGTAVRTAEMLAENRISPTASNKQTREVVPGARGAEYLNIPIHSVRLPGIIAQQQVIFGNTGETLTLRHDTIDRECFMPGVLLACQKVMALDHLVYGLEHVL